MQVQNLASSRIADPPAAIPVREDDNRIKLIGIAKTFHHDQQIYSEGAEPDFIYKVVSGAVRSLRFLADGRRQIDDFYLPGDLFGIELGAERRGAAEAIGEVVVIIARRSTLASGAELWRHAMHALQRSRGHVLTLGRRSATEKLAHFLIGLAERVDAHDALTLPMSRQDMADYLGLTIETVSRTLTRLQWLGLIRLDGRRRVRFTRPAALAGLCE